MLIYKILLPAEWAAFEAAGSFAGTAYDRSCGFIHCSSGEQLAATARRVFGAEPALVVVVLDAELLGAHVRWEASSSGVEYPHVYAPLPRRAVVATHLVAGAAAVDEALSPD